MKFSENWLRSLVNPSCSSDELAHALTMAGIEVENIQPVAAVFDRVVVAEVKLPAIVFPERVVDASVAEVVAFNTPVAMFDDVALVIVAFCAVNPSTFRTFAHNVARTFKLVIDEVEIVVVPKVVVPEDNVPVIVEF